MEFVRGRQWKMKLSYIVLLGDNAPQKEELSTRHHRVVVDASREARIGPYSVDVLKRPAPLMNACLLGTSSRVRYDSVVLLFLMIHNFY